VSYVTWMTFGAPRVPQVPPSTRVSRARPARHDTTVEIARIERLVRIAGSAPIRIEVIVVIG
jgi:hypothetical protein